MNPRSRPVRALSADARSAAAAPRRSESPLPALPPGPPANGLPHALSAIPQYAIAHVESASATAWNAACPCSHQNECSNASARLKRCCASGLHEIEKTTRPSCSADRGGRGGPCSCCAQREEESNVARHATTEEVRVMDGSANKGTLEFPVQ